MISTREAFHGWVLNNALAATAALAIGIFMLWARFPPVNILASTILPPVVNPGGEVTVKNDIQWYRTDCPEVFVSATVVDARGFSHAIETKFVGAPHLRDKTSRDWPIPATMPPGPAMLKSRVTFFCPPFYHWWPNVLEVPDLYFIVEHPP